MADVRIKYKVDKGELVIARNELAKINKELGVTEKQSKGLSTGVKAVGGAIVAAFTIDKLVDFGRQVISITAEFDKLRAVLTNTLGSKSQADAAFQRIQDFASKTPFAVSQLTASFVKLANQGFVPTNEQLRKLGDLAASTGKDFDMLTEAIIDAQVGEFERLKEFGIRATKEGDNVTFAFKGVQTQTEFTSDAIRAYILSLGDLEGVSGSMAAISKTLGGQISNLGDSFDALFYALGQASGGIIMTVLSGLNEAVQIVTRIINASNGITSDASDMLNKLNEEFQNLDSAKDYEKAIDEVSKRIINLQSSIQSNIEQQQKLSSTQSDVVSSTKTQIQEIDSASLAAKQASGAYDELAEALGATETAQSDTTETQKEATQSFDDLTTSIQDQAISITVLQDFLEQLKQKYAEVSSVDKQTFTEATEIKRQAVKELETDILVSDGQIVKSHTQTEEERVKATRNAEEQIRSEREATFIATIQLADALSQSIINILGRNSRAGKAAALFQIQLASAEAIAKAVAAAQSVPFPGNLAAIAVGVAAVTANIARSRQIAQGASVPRFKDGVINLQGPGTGTSDSIPARLSRGESVMTHAETRNFMPTLRAIRENRIDPELLNAVAEGKAKPTVFNQVVEVPRDEFSWNEDGFTKYMRRKNIIIEEKTRRYKC